MRALLITLLVVLAVYALIVLAFLIAGRKVAGEVLRLVPNLVLLFRDLLRDPAVPLASKLVLGFAVIWIASPIDLLPEFLPVIGPMDDAVVAALALRHLIKRSGVETVRRHWRGEPATLSLLLRAMRLSSS